MNQRGEWEIVVDWLSRPPQLLTDYQNNMLDHLWQTRASRRVQFEAWLDKQLRGMDDGQESRR